MCFFPIPNLNIKSEAYKKGVHEFDCGACPECLAKRARHWALRAVYECRNKPACMVTLTYDTYVKDRQGRVIGERVSDMSVDKRDCQLFVKRLRKYFKDRKIKYLITAEYGKRTHRAHYHALLFNVQFSDVVYYKKSKRGNVIYKSKILTDLWGNGICTVDSINVNASVARYCTKYCAKDGRSDDTFMLFSRGIGEEELLKDFNCKSYVVEGKEYPIPRQIWQKKISEWYAGVLPEFTYRYKNRHLVTDEEFLENVRQRKAYRDLRDNDIDYRHYIEYWRKRADLNENRRLSPFKRILALPDEKYMAYKVKALDCLRDRLRGVPRIAPRSNCKSEYFKYLRQRRIEPLPSCHARANDTMRAIPVLVNRSKFKLDRKYLPCSLENFIFLEENCPFPIDS